MNKKYNNYFQNAYTSVPIQDNFNQIQFIPNGLARIEFIALQLYIQNDSIKDSIILAAKFIDEIEKFKTEILETKESNLQIIQ
jgi:hypothetical protein